MPIRPPRLDDRRYADLVAELCARIPAHTPEWTDPVPGDPGRTLIELFAWLADTILYRANVVPERQRMEFLRMLGVSMRGARPARGLVALSWKDLDRPTAAVEAQTLRPWASVKGPVPFETRDPLTLLPVLATVFHKRVPTSAETASVTRLLPELADVYRLGASRPRAYVTSPTFPEGGAGVDLVTETVDKCLWIGLFAGHADRVADARACLGRAADGSRQVLNVGVIPKLADQDPLAMDLGGDTRPRALVWEITTPRTTRRGLPELLELEVAADGTRGFTREGIVRLVLPDDRDIGAPSNDVRADLLAGVGARPPRLDDRAVAARLVAWIRVRPRVRVDHLPLAWIGVNAVAVDQRRTLVDVAVGTSDGAPDQRFALPSGAVEREGFVLEVEEDGAGWVEWALVPHVALAARDARAYALDDEEGEVVFGDGLRGRVPARGARIRVRTMRAGGGVAGNLPAGSLKSVSALRLDGTSVDRTIELVQPAPTAGGAEAESLVEAERRVPAMLKHGERAVTASDLVDVAAATPGVQLARIEVIKGFKPQQRLQGVPGAVSLMVLPSVQGRLPPNPQPSRHTIEAVHDHVAARVPLATELYVIGTEYVGIGIGVGVEVRGGFDRDVTLQAVRDELRRFLWPVAPGGPPEAPTGWPLGRAVRDRELEVAVARVPGVDEVRGVKLFLRDARGEWARVPVGADRAADVPLKPWQLPEIQGLVVVDDDAPDRLDTDALGEGDEVAVPVVPERC